MNISYTIRACDADDQTTIFTIINEPAEVYRNVIPIDRYHEQYMPNFKEMDEVNGMPSSRTK